MIELEKGLEDRELLEKAVDSMLSIDFDVGSVRTKEEKIRNLAVLPSI